MAPTGVGLNPEMWGLREHLYKHIKCKLPLDPLREVTN